MNAFVVSGPKVLETTLTGHSDAIWSLSYLGSRQQLLSASADGTVKLWSPLASKPPNLLRTFGYPPGGAAGDGSGGGGTSDNTSPAPSSVDWVRVDPNHMVAGYTNGACMIYDVEKGKQVVRLDTFQVSGYLTYLELFKVIADCRIPSEHGQIAKM